MLDTTLRNATLSDLAEVLKHQADARFDVVAHSESLSYRDGVLVVRGADAILSEDGVTPVETHLRPTEIFEDGLSLRLDIPRRYIHKMRGVQEGDLLDHNVNTWLTRSGRKWFVRGFKEDGASEGIARAFLSDRFNAIDNFDVLVASLKGVQDAGVEAQVVGCDLSERRMRVMVEVPEIQALAPTLLRNYRSPFTGQTGAENPTVFAGFVISNSETGGGAFTITPRLVVQVCKNGMTMTKDALRKVHLGASLDEGIIEWSDDTNRKNIELVTAQARDAVATFCNTDYVAAKILEIEERSGITVAEPTKVIEKVSKKFSFSEAESEGILGHFISGGDVTTGGVFQAVTSFAQTVLDPDRAAAMEEIAVDVLDFAVSLAR